MERASAWAHRLVDLFLFYRSIASCSTKHILRAATQLAHVPIELIAALPTLSASSIFFFFSRLILRSFDNVCRHRSCPVALRSLLRPFIPYLVCLQPHYTFLITGTSEVALKSSKHVLKTVLLLVEEGTTIASIRIAFFQWPSLSSGGRVWEMVYKVAEWIRRRLVQDVVAPLLPCVLTALLYVPHQRHLRGRH
jgi:hypothetical protein